jgi:hypothetical protein
MPELIFGTWAHPNGVLHKSLPSVCVSACVFLLSLQGKDLVKCILPFIARQRLGEHVPTATNTRNNRRIVGRVYLWVRLGNNSVKTFPRQRIIVGCFVFYAVRVLSKESRGLFCPRTYYYTGVNIVSLIKEEHRLGCLRTGCWGEYLHLRGIK